ncbi:DUF3987 domain-containing protein [Bradyrhizobium sp. AUGA SZCCT0158]|uniref:YfjI family protein n=1 Tax=Bradyrhizobium sp. AUGA SZCCT0158 TaxID=2807661 RepID=UPI001BA4B7AA|nr:YfjI family protein [Bradyrhizobium sp. AUGA SZCCT0158]MBR1197807.1 DUF3987 domain-containing protein [Bradyrhizobium sp. AUGA SZCCT0158]
MTEVVTVLKELQGPRPLPLVREVVPADAFPVEALGEVLGSAALAIHDHVQSPLAMCGQAVLAAATLTVQGHADVEVATGQVKPLSNFYLTIAASGERKTATDSMALSPIRKHESYLAEIYQAELPRFQNDMIAWEAARKKAVTSNKGNRAAVRDALNGLGPRPVGPLLPMLTCPEPTFEGLTLALQLGQPSIGIFSSEGGQFIGGHGMSAENKLASAAGYSSIWDGDPIKRVRAKDGVTILVGRRLSTHLMVQPDVANLLLSDALLADQGMLSRYLVTAPDSRSGQRFSRDPSPDSRLKMMAYENHMHEILRRQLPLAVGKANELEPRVLRLSADAHTLQNNFADHIERQIGPNGELKPISGLANKLPEHAGRLAGVLTIFENPDAHEISQDFMARGIMLAQHFAGEALRLFQGARIDADLRHAARLLDWLHNSWNETNISLPDIYQRGPNSIGSRETALHLVRILETHAWVVKLPGGAVVGGEPRRDVWRIIRNS